jgi:DNA-binding protein YbaB
MSSVASSSNNRPDLTQLKDDPGANEGVVVSNALMDAVQGLGQLIAENKKVSGLYKDTVESGLNLIQEEVTNISSLIDELSRIIGVLKKQQEENPSEEKMAEYEDQIDKLTLQKKELIDVITYANGIIRQNGIDNTVLDPKPTSDMIDQIVKSLRSAKQAAETSITESGNNPPQSSPQNNGASLNSNYAVPVSPYGAAAGLIAEAEKNITRAKTDDANNTLYDNYKKQLGNMQGNLTQPELKAANDQLDAIVLNGNNRRGGKRTHRRHTTEKSRTLRKMKKSKTLRKSTKSRTLRKMKKRNYKGGFHAEAVKSRRNSKRRHDTSTH